MKRASKYIDYIFIYTLLASIDSYTTDWAINRSNGLFYELNPNFVSIDFFSIFLTQMSVLPIFFAFLFISFSFESLPKRVSKLLALNGSAGDFFWIKIPGSVAISVLFVMLSTCLNNFFVLMGVGSLFDFLLSFIFDQPLHKVAFFPIFTAILILLFLPVSYMLLSRVRGANPT